MPISRTDKPASAASRAEEAPPTPARSTVPAFSFETHAAEPELQITRGNAAAVSRPEPEQGIDLSGKPKVVCFIGRGKTGKTTTIRWMAERTIAAGREVLMADMDPTNDTFSKYLDGVARPSDPSDPALALKWLDRLLQHAMQHMTSAVIDLGGGDTTLRRLVSQIPDLVPMLEAAGFAVVAIHTVGPQEEDLSPLATLEALGFQPRATAIVLNEGLMEVGDTPASAFTRIFRHSAFRGVTDRGAVPVWMPRLLVASQVETRRLHYRDAADGHSGQGTTPLGPFDRARVANWLREMDQSFAGIRTWMP